MKITYESYGEKTTIEGVDDDINVQELKELLIKLCLSQGWSKENLKLIFKK